MSLLVPPSLRANDPNNHAALGTGAQSERAARMRSMVRSRIVASETIAAAATCPRLRTYSFAGGCSSQRTTPASVNSRRTSLARD